MVKRKKGRQRELPFVRVGGKRRGAGRKPNGRRAGVSHLKRAALASRYPVHVNVKVVEGVGSLRTVRAREVIVEAIRAANERFGFRVVHYSIQSNHIHLLVEAKDRRSVSRGMQGLLIRVARGLNKSWDRRGKVFADRYHDVILRSPRQVRRAIVYVLQNARKYARGRTASALDAFASGYWFDGWRKRPRLDASLPDCPTAQARTWLLAKGWRRHGLVAITELPAPAS